MNRTVGDLARQTLEGIGMKGTGHRWRATKRRVPRLPTLTQEERKQAESIMPEAPDRPLSRSEKLRKEFDRYLTKCVEMAQKLHSCLELNVEYHEHYDAVTFKTVFYKSPVKGQNN